MKTTMIYEYGMIDRHYSPKAAPLRGLIDRKKDKNGLFYDLLFYDRKLETAEEKGFGLQYLGTEDSRHEHDKGPVEPLLQNHGNRRPGRYAGIYQNAGGTR